MNILFQLMYVICNILHFIMVADEYLIVLIESSYNYAKRLIFKHKVMNILF